MKHLKDVETDRYVLETYECDCGFHIGLDTSYLDQVGNIIIPCPSCGKNLDTEILGGMPIEKRKFKMIPRKTYIATVQILVHPSENLEDEDQACDWFSALLSENSKILDWGYLKVNGQYLFPQEKFINDDYEEGDFLK